MDFTVIRAMRFVPLSPQIREAGAVAAERLESARGAAAARPRDGAAGRPQHGEQGDPPPQGRLRHLHRGRQVQAGISRSNETSSTQMMEIFAS